MKEMIQSNKLYLNSNGEDWRYIPILEYFDCLDKPLEELLQYLFIANVSSSCCCRQRSNLRTCSWQMALRMLIYRSL